MPQLPHFTGRPWVTWSTRMTSLPARKSHRPLGSNRAGARCDHVRLPASLQVMAERVISSDLENQRLERNRKNRKRKAGWFNVDLMLCWWCNAFRSVLEGMKSFQISYLWWSLHENIFPHIPIFSQMKLNNWKQGKCCARSALGGEDPDSMTCRHVITWNMSEMFCKDPPLSFFRFYPLVLFLSRASRVLFRKMAFHSCLKCFGHCGMQDPSGLSFSYWPATAFGTSWAAKQRWISYGTNWVTPTASASKRTHPGPR